MKYNLAIVGFGGMGSYHFSSIREQLPEINVVGVYDIREERRNAAKEQGLKAYGSLEELEQDETIDIVLVATPNNFHKDLSIRMLRSGKNVVCEKPVTMNAAELEEIIAIMTETGKHFSVHQNRRWDKDFVIMKKIVDESLLVRPYVIESRVQGSKRVLAGWRGYKINGGGMVLDWGIHLFDQLYCLTGWDDIVSVHADLTYVTNAEVDDGFSVTLKFRNGLVAFVEVGTSNFIELPRWYVQGENGSMVINDWNMNGKIVKVTDWENRDAVPVQTSAGMTKTMAPRTDDTIATFPIPRVPSDERDYYRNVAKAIHGEEKQLITHDQLRRTMKLMEAVFRSGETGEVIKETI